MFSKIASSVLAASAILNGAQASLFNRQVECIGEPIIVHVSTVVVTYPVYINTYITANTIININGGVTININNAPTYINTIITATTTSVVTSVLTETATDTATVTTTATATPTAAPEAPFVIAIVGAAAGKRQASTQGYVGFSGNTGNIVFLKSQAALFTTSGGELFSQDSFIGLTSPELGDGYGPFELFGLRPFISTTWFAQAGGAVSFTNPAFAGGSAEFCLDANGDLFDEYTTTTPFACTIVTLVAETPESDVSPGSTSSSSAIVGTTTLPDGEVSTFTSPVPTSTASNNLTETASVGTTTLPDGEITTFTSPVPTSTASNNLTETASVGTTTLPDGEITTYTSPVVPSTTASNNFTASVGTTTLPDGEVSTFTTEGPTITATNNFTASVGTTTLTDGEVSTFTSEVPTITATNNFTVTATDSVSTVTQTDGSVTTFTDPGFNITATETATETTTATTTSDSGLPTVPVATPFVIQIETQTQKAKRALLFLKFVAGIAETTETRSDASTFTTFGYELFSGGSNVGLSDVDITTGYAPFKLFSGPADVSKSFYVAVSGIFEFTPTSNLGVELGITASYCLSDDGRVIAKYSSASSPPFVCAEVSITISLDIESGPTTTSATTTSTSSSTSSTATNVSDDLSVPDPTPAVKPRYAYKKKSVVASGQVKNRRGGVLRSPFAPKA